MVDDNRHHRATEIRGSALYKTLSKVAVWMDRYYIDPVLGIAPGGWGDLLSAVLAVPFVWFSLTVVRSVPLSLAIVFNVLKDIAVGLIPFFVGDVLDVFSRPYARNMRLVEGFIEGDQTVIREVNRKAWSFALAIVACIALIVGMVWLAAKVVSSIPWSALW
jgi:hypothetical protein